MPSGFADGVDNNTNLSSEQVQDIIGTMLSGNTEAGISVTYDDTNNEIDFSVTSNFMNTNYTGNSSRTHTNNANNFTIRNDDGTILATLNLGQGQTYLSNNWTSASGQSAYSSFLIDEFRTRIVYSDGTDIAQLDLDISNGYAIYDFSNLPEFANSADADNALPEGAVYNSGGYLRVAN